MTHLWRLSGLCHLNLDFSVVRIFCSCFSDFLNNTSFKSVPSGETEGYFLWPVVSDLPAALLLGGLLFLAPSGVPGYFVTLFSFSPSFLGCCESCGTFLYNQTLSEGAVECWNLSVSNFRKSSKLISLVLVLELEHTRYSRQCGRPYIFTVIIIVQGLFSNN